MRRTRRDVLAAVLAASSAALAGCEGREIIRLRGAGATLPSNQFAAWFAAFARDVPRARVDYAPIGSGAGIRQLAARRIDFGASDVDLDEEERASIGDDVLVVPVAASALAIVFHLPEHAGGPLRLSRETIARIYLGEITRWDDPAIVRDNPGAALPPRPITPVGRADGGGSTAVLTKALASKLPRWREAVGVGRAAAHPRSINARGSDGVAGAVRDLPGAIGYVEVARALAVSLPVASLDADSGSFVAPTVRAVREATPALFGCGGDASAGGYPLASPTYLVVPADLADVARGAALARLLYWVLGDGQRSLASAAPGDEALASALLPLSSCAAEAARTTILRLRSGDVPLLSID